MKFRAAKLSLFRLEGQRFLEKPEEKLELLRQTVSRESSLSRPSDSISSRDNEQSCYDFITVEGNEIALITVNFDV